MARNHKDNYGTPNTYRSTPGDTYIYAALCIGLMVLLLVVVFNAGNNP